MTSRFSTACFPLADLQIILTLTGELERTSFFCLIIVGGGQLTL